MVAMAPPLDDRSADRRIDMRDMDPVSRFATVATRAALSNAGFSVRPKDLAEVGFYLGISEAPSLAEAAHITDVLENNFALQQVQAFPYIVPNSIAGNVCRALMLSGHNTVLCGGPGAGLSTLGLAALAIGEGHAAACLAGSADEISQRTAQDFVSAGVWPLAEGVAPAEGAVVFMLERESVARARGAVPVARICGMAFSTEVEHATTADDSVGKLVDTIVRSLSNAGIGPGEVASVCCRTNDYREREALVSVFGTADRPVIDVSTTVGSADSTLPLLSLAFSIWERPVGRLEEKKYILAYFSSPQGVSSAIVFEKLKI
jgi:3-oxoacyl-(acyl-carrier-protein) synthase